MLYVTYHNNAHEASLSQPSNNTCTLIRLMFDEARWAVIALSYYRSPRPIHVTYRRACINCNRLSLESYGRAWVLSISGFMTTILCHLNHSWSYTIISTLWPDIIFVVCSLLAICLGILLWFIMRQSNQWLKLSYRFMIYPVIQLL